MSDATERFLKAAQAITAMLDEDGEHAAGEIAAAIWHAIDAVGLPASMAARIRIQLEDQTP